MVKAVNNVNLKVKRGDFLMIFGRTGSGKTTLLSLMVGLTRPSHGNIFIEEVDLWKLNETERARLRAGKFGFIFQIPSLIPNLTVIDNVLLPAAFAPKVQLDARDRAMRLLEEMEMTKRAYALPSQLSGGEQKRAVIARALINNPEVIVADEPTSDIDEATEREIMEIFKRLHNQGITIVMVTHSSALATYATRVFKMSEGILEPQHK